MAIHVYIHQTNCFHNANTFSLVAGVGFGSPLYTVIEGEEEIAVVCVFILSGELTDVVSLNYSLSSEPHDATGECIVI